MKNLRGFVPILMFVLWSTGCGSQHDQQTASAAAPAAVAPTGSNPEPVDAQAPPVHATLPNEPSRPAPAPQAPSGGQSASTPVLVTIPVGTGIRVRLENSLDTKYSHPGERFEAYLDDPVTWGDRVVVPKGTVFEGHVIAVKRSGRLRGRALLGITLDSFRLNGATYRVATGADFRTSNSHKKRNLAIIGGGSGTGVAIGAAAGGGVGALVGAGAGAAVGTTGAFISGRKDVKLPIETPLVFSLHSAVTVRG